MAISAFLHGLWQRWLQGDEPEPGGGYPIVDANIISGGGTQTQAEQQALYAVAPVEFTGTGAIAVSHPVAVASATVQVRVKFATKPTAQVPKEALVISINHNSDSIAEATGYPSDGLTDGNVVTPTFDTLAVSGDAVEVAFPGVDGLGWTVYVTLGIPS